MLPLDTQIIILLGAVPLYPSRAYHTMHSLFFLLPFLFFFLTVDIGVRTSRAMLLGGQLLVLFDTGG